MYRAIVSLFFTISLCWTPQALWSNPLPETLDKESFPATVVEEVIVPNPDELFSLMDKLGQPDWSSRVRKNVELPKLMGRTEVALLFGTLIADGFIAVQAEDAGQVKFLGNEIRELAEDLGLRDAVIPHCQAIIEACDRQEWPKVREELDKTHKTVRDAMVKMRDDDLAQFVSIAGWVRGTEVLTGLIQEAFSADKAEILNQPELAAHFESKLGAIVAKEPGEAQIAQILNGLTEIRKLMAQHPSGSIPAGTVDQIHAICHDLVKIIFPTGSTANNAQ